MEPKTTNQLDRLLAGGELSGPEADAIFDRVYESVAREGYVRRPARAVLPRAVWLGGALCAAAAAVMFMLVRPAEQPDGDLAARGPVGSATTLEVKCSGGTLSACPISTKLVFLVSGDAPAGFLSAYAEPLEAGAERVWYFSRETSSPELAPSSDGTRVFDRAVALAGSHRPGRYRVHLFLATQPLAREEMLAGPRPQRMLSSTQYDVTITPGE